MPRGKKSTIETSVSAPVQAGEVKLTSALWQIRELCRKHHLQVWKTQSLANQIYQDLLFIYHIPELVQNGRLELDVERIGDGKISEVSYTSLLSLKEPQLINTAFKRLWKELQRSVLKDLFEGRDFTMVEIEKKNPERYMALLLDLFRYLASVKLETYDSNAGYTYFKKDLNKAIAKTFGQFYTPQNVTYSVVKEVNPKVGEHVLDPSCGSCSFLAEAANFIEKKEGVDMATAFENLYGTEVEFNIYAEGIMNMFINFGILPDMKEKIREVDALLAMAKETVLFDKIIANPPFGADASTFHEFYFKTVLEPKGKRIVKKTIVNPEVLCQIPYPNTKESAVLFFQYIIQKLKVGGKAGVVMSSTLLNDGNKEMIQWFLESCSLDKVIINPAGTFKEQGTGIETFSFVFTKGKPTTTVSIVMLGAEETVVRSLTLDQIKAAGWKLQMKEEEKKESYSGQYDMVRIGDLFQRISGKKLTLEEALNGDIPLYSASVKIHRHNESHYDATQSIIQACIGSNLEECIHFVETPFATTGNLWILRSKCDSLSLKYAFYYLRLSKIILTCSSDHSRPMANFGQFSELTIPLPPHAIQEQIIASLDRILADPHDSKDCLSFTSNAMDLMLKDPTGKLLEDVLIGLRLKRAHLINADSVKAQMAAVVRSVGQRGYERKKLGELCNDVSTSKNIPSSERVDGHFRFFTCSREASTHNQYHYEGSFLIHGSRGSTIHESLFLTEDEKFAIGTSMFLSKIKEDSKVSLNFVYYYLLFNPSLTNRHVTSAAIPMITKTNYYNIEIQFPPLAEQEKILAILNEMDAERKVLEQMAAKAEERAKFILEGYLTSSSATSEKSKKKIQIDDSEEIIFGED